MFLTRCFYAAVAAALMIIVLFSLYKLKSSDAYQLKLLEKSGKLPVLDLSDDLAGPDTDDNGIRDDIDAYIRKNFTKPEERKAVEQYARTTQAELMVDINDRRAVRLANETNNRAYNCMRFTFEDRAKYSRFMDEIFSMTMNSRKRVKQYDRYDAALSGSSWELPRGDTCDK